MSIALHIRRIEADGARSPDVETLTLDQPRVVIGRGAHADLRLPSRGVSSTHAVISVASGEIAIVDEHSTNGTAVNAQPLVRGRRKVMKSGDRVVVPGYEITLETSAAPADPRDKTAQLVRRLLAHAGTDCTQPPELVLATGRRAGRRYALEGVGTVLRIGRADPSEVQIEEHNCARVHAEVTRESSGVVLRLIAPEGGLFVGGRAVSERKLRHGDEVQIGRTVLVYADPTEERLRMYDGGHDEPAAMTIPPPPPVELPASVKTPALASTALVSDDDALDALDAMEKTDVISPAQSEREARGRTLPPRRPLPARRAPGADWVVITLALVILAVSATALVVLLRGTPSTSSKAALSVREAPTRVLAAHLPA